jgi:SAM-dependent methyltransferase
MAWLPLARRLQALIPPRQQLPARLLFCRARSLFFRGDAVHCPCCGGSYSRFLGIGSPPRAAACPGCNSLERQRLLYLYLRERTNLFRDRLRVLHVAPEDCLQPQLARQANLDYLSADLAAGSAMAAIDITSIAFPDAAFDVILCSHVLEHVVDDGRAMRELCRVLRPGGWAILQVPMDPARAITFEDSSVTTAAERERLFGQWDHVRVYGRDYPARLRAAGFHVAVMPFAAELAPEQVRRCGLDPREEVFHCSKPRA